MKNYKPIGNYIQPIDVRNTALQDLPLMGLSISKEFIPSVANIIGTDLSNYKVIKRNQFACSLMQVSRDGKMPVAMYCDDKAIMSPAYPMFEIKDENALLPEYLMMWFSRTEFDREAAYYAVGGVRGNLPWDDFLEMKIPIPPIARQRELVAQYNAVQNRINQNNQLIAKLEETAQAVYKEWFVDGVDEKWEVKKLGDLFDKSFGGDWGKESKEGNYKCKVKCIRGTDIPNFKFGDIQDAPVRYILEQNVISKSIEENYLIIEISGGSPIQSTGRTAIVSKYHLAMIDEKLICSNFCRVLVPKKSILSYFLFSHIEYLYNQEYLFTYENSTTGVKNFDLSAFFEEEKLSLPTENLLIQFNKTVGCLIKLIVTKQRESQKLEQLKVLLLSRMASIEKNSTFAVENNRVFAGINTNVATI